MNEPIYRQRISEYIRANANPVDKFGHQPRLYRLACELAESHPFDDDVVFAAAWMHDLGVFIGHRPEDLKALEAWDMLAYAEKVVPGLLEQFGFPSAKIPAVMSTIRTHQATSKPESFEAVLIHDADILEQLGAIGACRNIAKVGRDTRFRLFSDAINYLKKKVVELPGLLILDSAQRTAIARRIALEEFIQAFEAEADTDFQDS